MTEPVSTAGLSAEEIARYSRHLTLPQVGMEGQQRLRRSSVLLIGAGGLGSPLALYLAAAGVGRIGIVDFDHVDVTNLQRQVLFNGGDVGRSKAECAAERMGQLNPHVVVEKHETRLDASNAEDLLAQYDLVVDGSDNFPTRYLVNDACVLFGKPNVYGSIFRFEGQVSVFCAPGGPCYRCLYPEPPAPGAVPNCAEGGVLGVLPGIIGSLQAMEAIKWILGRGESLVGRLVLFDALELRFRELKLRRDEGCPVCGDRPTIRELRQVDEVCDLGLELEADTEFGAEELRQRLDRGEAWVLLDVRTPAEWEICRLDGAKLVPIAELGARVSELDPAAGIVVYCHHGLRGRQALQILQGAGFTRVRNLDGGIDAWSRDVDPSVPRY